MTPARLAVFRELLRRELGERYRGTLLGGLWYLVLPLAQLAVLAWVFGHLLPARTGTPVPYAAFLALGLWPWSLFANAVGRSVTALTDNASLIGKVAVPHRLYVDARVAASLLVDLSGFVIVLVALSLLGVTLSGSGVPAVLMGLAVLLTYALAVSRLVALLHAFLRDVAAALSQLLSLGFFLTPVLYQRAQLPSPLRQALLFNPMTAPVETIRNGLLGEPIAWLALLVSALGAALLLWLAGSLAVRARPHLEDFL